MTTPIKKAVIEQILSYTLQGKRYDCGNKYGYLKATVEYALKHSELKNQFKQYLVNLIKGA